METKQNPSSFSRPTAFKLTIKEILSGEYVQEENEQMPNYLLTLDHRKVYRLSLIAVILNKEQQGSITNFLLDDGTGTIILRSFEENQRFQQLNVGDAISIIGKVRVYNDEKYLSPEIIKKNDPLWLKVRALELNLISAPAEVPAVAKKNSATVKKTEKPLQKVKTLPQQIEAEEIIEEELEDDKETIFPTQKMIKLIQELDSGNGVLIEDILEKSPLGNTEEMLKKMLQKGDIFQIQPGKVKVL